MPPFDRGRIGHKRSIWWLSLDAHFGLLHYWIRNSGWNQCFDALNALHVAMRVLNQVKYVLISNKKKIHKEALASKAFTYGTRNRQHSAPLLHSVTDDFNKTKCSTNEQYKNAKSTLKLK